MDKPDNPPAFPMPGLRTGMTLRDYFAAKWLQGWVANAESPDMQAEKAAAYAYAMADAMLKARQS